MPTYDYVCRACDHRFEEFQSMSAKPLRKCPECAAMKLERLIGTGAAVIFKGGGFYETDYRSDSYKKGAEADKKASEPKKDAASSSSSSSSDSKKPDDKADGAKKAGSKKNAKPGGS